jgi:quinoprotein glucose dehydrogenase
LCLIGSACLFPSPARVAAAESGYRLFAHTNLVAWCIVPFDAKKRGPVERAEMLARLQLSMLAYDYRAEHIPTFDAEVEALRAKGIRLLAWWFPGELNDEAKSILRVLEKHGLRDVQLWVTGGGSEPADAQEQQARIEAEARRIEPIADAAAAIGCSVALYNHGGWFGEPANQIEIIEKLRTLGVTNAGIVYNLHHGHDHLDRFAELLAQMKPYLVALNLNGMFRNGDKENRKIVPLGQGEMDLALLRTIRESGWRGPIGILNHTDADAEERLRDNLEGLEWLVAQLDAATAGRKPQPRTWIDYWGVEDPGEREKLPLYQYVPAAKPEELTPSNARPAKETYLSWHRSHGDNGGTRYSALNQVNRQNVANLQVAWTYQSRDASNNLQCNPIIVGGIMFAPTPGKFVVGVDVRQGKELWRFKPEGRPAFRGLVYWPGNPAANAAARVMFTAGKFLYALDPRTGQPISSFGENGRATLPGRTDGDFGAATAGPAYFQNILVVPGFIKDVWGFDIVSGRLLWTFHTVPHPGEFGYETWDQPEEYGANCWGGMAMDEERGIAFVTTGSPKPNFIGSRHHGDNLFANCVIALDARTGKRLWHFQEIRHDIWDLDIPAPPNLATITRDGRRVDVVAAVTKIGNTLLLDRVSGKPVFPFRLRRAPTSDLRGERTAPYQPAPELPEPFSKMEYTREDLTDRTEEAQDFAQTRFKSATTGWFRPASEGRPNLYFGIDGGAEWTGACVDAETGRLYVSANHMGWYISVFRNDDPPFDPGWPMTPGRQIYEANCAQCHATNMLGISIAPPLRGLRQRLTFEAVTNQILAGKNAMPAHTHFTPEQVRAVADYLLWRDRPLPPTPPRGQRPEYNVTGYPKFYDPEGYPANKPPWGTLNCIDLNTGKLVWKVPLGEYEKLKAEGVPKTGTENYGGPIVTAGGLVFCAGTRDHKIRAFDTDTGAELWEAKLPFVGNAPPATCLVDGRQYIIVSATGANKLGTPYGDAYVAFALPADKLR